ncbi:CPBP family intramembrane glutamic endopeptidase [Streptomyces yerevanensis]|uniref:CPBP family intramembrane glutamic endopeptidase n=1 Tax=Streptomyces yerevanensis TaxID=66378 RepID=UPI000A4A4D50|nr:CPBP family intramembrane glutamic endopeptidase [Streptomyces yerevanensis]
MTEQLSHRMRSGRTSTVTALVGAVTLLVLTNLVNNRWAPSWVVLSSAIASAALIAIMFRAGGGWADLGLSRDTLGRGLRWALALAGIVAAVYLCAAALPVTRGLFEDERASGLSGAEVVGRVLIKVPIGTVLLEEVAFRGVLYGLVLRARGAVAATVFSSVLFGLWHILPSLHLTDSNQAVGSLFGQSPLGTVLATAGAVLLTAAAGCLFCYLRHRTGSLLAPMGLHWATNAFGYVFSSVLA